MLMYNIKSLTLLIIIILCIDKYLHFNLTLNQKKLLSIKNNNL